MLSFKRRRKTIFTIFLIITLIIYTLQNFRKQTSVVLEPKSHIPEITISDVIMKLEREELNENKTGFSVDKIREAMKYSWDAYKKYAWSMDELLPLSHHGSKWMKAGLSIIDAIDTLFLFNLKQEYQEATNFIVSEAHFDYDNDHTSVFESTIRIIGGLSSIHHLDSKPDFVSKLIVIADKLMHAFKKNSFPYPDINLANSRGYLPSFSSSLSLSEFTSIQLEFNQVSRITKDPKYSLAALKALSLVLEKNKDRDLFPVMFKDGSFLPDTSSTITLGARGDSYYEYLLKVWIQTGKQLNVIKNKYLQSVEAVKQRLTRRSYPNGFLYIGELISGSFFSPKMDHLVCFLPGTLAYGHLHGMPESHLNLAKELMAGCYQFYNQTLTGLSPEIVVWNTKPESTNKESIPTDFVIKPNDGFCLLRPETIESLFYMYRITKNSIYQEWGWKIFESFNKHAKLLYGQGFASVKDVMKIPTSFIDKMESFWLAETLKYFLLLFDDDAYSKVDLRYWVFNTEAHPLPLDSSDAEFYKPILEQVFNWTNNQL